jgi:hypothetical protein
MRWRKQASVTFIINLLDRGGIVNPPFIVALMLYLIFPVAIVAPDLVSPTTY